MGRPSATIGNGVAASASPRLQPQPHAGEDRTPYGFGGRGVDGIGGRGFGRVSSDANLSWLPSRSGRRSLPLDDQRSKTSNRLIATVFLIVFSRIPTK